MVNISGCVSKTFHPVFLSQPRVPGKDGGGGSECVRLCVPTSPWHKYGELGMLNTTRGIFPQMEILGLTV